jgi:hypothetical protein
VSERLAIDPKMFISGPYVGCPSTPAPTVPQLCPHALVYQGRAFVALINLNAEDRYTVTIHARQR